MAEQTAGTVTLTDAANGDITLAPDGTGRTKVTNATSSSTQTVTTDGKGTCLLHGFRVLISKENKKWQHQI